MSSDATASPRTRNRSLDGLRGIAIVLVMLSHLWTLVPVKWISGQPTLSWIFSNGNLAVSVFFVIGGYFVGVGLLASTDRNSPGGTVRWVLRSFLRISASVYCLLAVILMASVLDKTDTYSTEQTRESVLHVMTYTWNWWVMSQALFARGDIGHLWYLSVYVQIMVCLAVTFVVLRRFRAVLLVVLTVAMVASSIWRAHLLETKGLYQALLATTARMDAMMWGAMLAVGLSLASASMRSWLKRTAPVTTTLGLVVCLLIVVTMNDAEHYFGIRGVVFNAGMCLAVVGLLHVDPKLLVFRGLSRQPLALLGEWSLSIYVWHYPIFWAVSRHSAGWHWGTRLVLALGLTAIASTMAQLMIDAPVKRLLNTRLPNRRKPAEATQ